MAKLQLRYNGCHGCLSNSKATLKEAGLRYSRDFIVEMHSDHRDEEVYKVHPEFIKHFSGAILINPETQSFINMYPNNESLQYSEGLKVAIQKLLK